MSSPRVCQGSDPALEPGPLTVWVLQAALGLEDGGGGEGRPPASPILSRRDPPASSAQDPALLLCSAPSPAPSTFGLTRAMRAAAGTSCFIPEGTLPGQRGQGPREAWGSGCKEERPGWQSTAVTRVTLRRLPSTEAKF